MLLFLVSSVSAEIYYYIPVKGKAEMKPLKECGEIEVKITDFKDFQYQIQDSNHKSIGKIWASIPLYVKKGNVIRQSKNGFKVQFINIDWLIMFMSNQGFVMVHHGKNLYKFKYNLQNEIALK